MSDNNGNTILIIEFADVQELSSLLDQVARSKNARSEFRLFV